jgi:hypothetical protein
MSSTCCRREANNFNILLARSVDEGGDGRDSGGFDYCGSSTPGDDRQKHTSAAHESGSGTLCVRIE